MTTSTIRFATQTGAEQARRLLQKNGIASTLRRNPNPNRNEGCSYVLFVHGDFAAALRVMERANLPHLKNESPRDTQ